MPFLKINYRNVGFLLFLKESGKLFIDEAFRVNINHIFASDEFKCQVVCG